MSEKSYDTKNLCQCQVRESSQGRANLGNRIIDSTQAFVAMWFDSSLDDAYYKGVKSGVEECGYSAKHIDQTEHLTKLTIRSWPKFVDRNL